MIKYYEYAQHRVNNRNRLIKSTDLLTAAKELGEKSPLYRSVFWYTEDVVDYIRTNKSISSYRGIRGIDQIAIDIDKGSNSDEYTLKKLRDYLHQLAELKVYPESFQVYFSGTGYHIFIAQEVFGFDPSKDIAFQVSETLKIVKLISDSAAVRAAQLIRIEHTLNEKSNLYKIPLTYEEAMTLEAEQIHELARTQRFDFEYHELEGNYELEKYVIGEQQIVQEEKAMQKDSYFNNRYAICIQELWRLGPTEGIRNNTVLRIASHFKRQGIPEEACIASMEHWNTKTVASLDDKVVRTKVSSVYNSPYRYGCNDFLLKKFCDRSCIFYKHKNLDIEPLLTVNDLHDEFRRHQDMVSRKDEFINLKDVFGLKVDCVLYPGEFSVIMGDTGVNKTSIVQNIMLGYDMVNERFNNTKESIIYYGPELTPGLMQLRHYCIISGLTEEEVLSKRDSELYKYQKMLNNIAIQAEILTMEQIENTIRDKQPTFLIIDYIEQIAHPSMNFREALAIADITRGLSAMAVKYNMHILGISQINRESAKDGTVSKHSGYGSGSIEKTARKLFSIEADEGSPYRRISMLKSNSSNPWGESPLIEYLPNWRFRRIS